MIVNDLKGKRFPVLDQGFVALIDVMGDDQAIVEAARLTARGTRRVSEDRPLIRYLMRHQHHTPFEMADVKLHVRVPMDCWRQWIRHRTASVNEYSTRYSEAIDAAQRTNPAQWRLQATANRQGSAGWLDEWPDVETMMEHHHDFPTAGSYLSDVEQELQVAARRVYEERLRFGVAKEQARKDLPLSTYTEAYWKCNLRNLFHFLGLRMDSHAQEEIHNYALVIAYKIVAPLFPICFEAFHDYILSAVTLSRVDLRVLAMVRQEHLTVPEAVVQLDLDPEKGEGLETVLKLRKAGLED